MDSLLNILSYVFSIAGLVLNLAATGVAVYRGHGVDRTLAWIFAIWAVPFAGAVAYFAFARPSVRRTARRMRQASASVRLASGHAQFAAARGRKVINRLDGPLLHLAYQLTGLPATEGNEVELLAEDQLAFQRLEEAIKSAQRFIWAEYYIIGNDVTGRRFLGLLANKARKGVSVRLLYDAVGSLGLDGKRLAAIRSAAGKPRLSCPSTRCDGDGAYTCGTIASSWSSTAKSASPAVRTWPTNIPAAPAAAGSGISAISTWRCAAPRWATWRRNSPRTGPLRPRRCSKPPPAPPPLPGASSIVSIVPSGPDQETNAIGMIYFAGIAAARQRIYLTTPYFVPDEPTMHALVSAALRGLDVRILVPSLEKNDVRLVAFAARSYFPELMRGGVRIFEYQPTSLHTKSLVVDSAWGIVGSANVDLRSFRLNFELSALVADPAFAKVLEQRFERDLKDSREVTAEMLDNQGFLAHLRDRTVRLLSPLL